MIVINRLKALCLWLPFLCGNWLVSHVRAVDTALEVGHPFVENFTPREYRADSQVWSATQDAEGIMYFGNKGIVLDYDGVTWRKIFISNDNYVIRGLALDPVSSTVYVGGLNNLGFLQSAPGGGKAFVSLLNQLPAADRNFGSIYRVYANQEGIFFVAAKQVMRWRDGHFMLWKFQITDRLQSEYVAGNFYVQSPDLGLQRLSGDHFLSASDDPFFRSATLVGIAPGPGGSLVIGTRHDGLFTLLDGALAPLACDLDEFFKSKEVRHLQRLRDGSLAVSTGTAGIVVLNPDNGFQGRWDEASGLQNQTALDLFQDREGGVWLCLYVGITRVQAASPLSIFDVSNGLKRTSIHSVRRYHGTLYVATDSGLYRLLKADPSLGLTARCERVSGMEADFWSLCASEHGLLVTGLGAIYELDDVGTATLIDKFPYSGSFMSPSRWRPGRVFLGTRSGLRSLRFDKTAGRWLDEGPVSGVAAEIHSFAETSDGDLWVGSNDHGLFRVQFAPDDATGQRGEAKITAFFGKPGPLIDTVEVWVGLSQDDILVTGTRKGLFRFNPAAGNFRPTNEYGTRFVDGSFDVDKFAPDQQGGGVWLTGRSTESPWADQQGGWAKAGREDGNGSEFEAFPHQVFDKLTAIDSLFPDEFGIVWMASPEGIVRLDAPAWLRRRAEKQTGFATLIRRAIATARTPVVGTAPDRPGPAVLTLPAVGARLDPAHSSVQFELAANTYAPGADLLYQTRLGDSGGGPWSLLDARARAEYTNLPAGNYVFEARAQNADGVLGQVATVRFVVLPPWQRTGWAYVLYAALAALTVVSITRWRLRQLRATNARLEALVGTRTDELRAHQIELVRAKDAADASNRAKSAFLANMSHELRTPLNAVLGYTQIMLKDGSTSEKNRERLGVVARSGEHLLGMINEVLDLSKIEAGKLPLDPADFPLRRLLDTAAETFRPRAAEKEIGFILRLTPDLPTVVCGDEGRLRQVLFNLLSNAVKFTGRGEVELTVARASANRLYFEVRDTGIGIAADEVANIFLPFHQAPESGAALAAQGTGLGLAISQRLVVLMGGELGVESNPMSGSRFWFDLPLPEAAAAVNPSTPPALSPPGALVAGYHGPRRRLLLVDDEETNRRILCELLAPLGFEVEESPGGEECLARCARPPRPDAVLLDLRMAGTDGFHAARALRLRPENAGLKVIAVSASVFEADRQQALDAGCDDFLPKPFTEDALLAALQRAFDLDWITTAPVPPSASGDPSGGEEIAPPAAELDTLLELSRRGDVLKIRRRLADLLASDPRYASFVEPLAGLAASYQMNRLRDTLLEKMKEEEKT